MDAALNQTGAFGLENKKVVLYLQINTHPIYIALGLTGGVRDTAKKEKEKTRKKKCQSAPHYKATTINKK